MKQLSVGVRWQTCPTIFAAAVIALSSFPFLQQPVSAQSVGLSGYVKTENIYDTRQVVQVREGQFHLYPQPESDESATDNLLYAAFQSRLRVAGAGTTALGADVTGLIETDFFGTGNDQLGQLRLRHALVRLNWESEELLFGQYWSPMFNIAVFPQTVSFNTGAPFQPFARFPQIRLTVNRSEFRFIAAVSQQRDAFSDIGGHKMQQQSGMPAGHAHAQYVHSGNVVGFGTYFKWIRPELTSDRFGATAVQAYALIDRSPLVLRTKLSYGGDLTDHLMTGGFVATTDGSYEPLRVGSVWVDADWNLTESMSAGLFGGYMTNRGTSSAVSVLLEDTDDDGIGDTEVKGTRADNLDYLWRIAPRIAFTSGQLRLAFEAEITSALFASGLDEHYAPVSVDADPAVTNVRALFAVYYFF